MADRLEMRMKCWKSLDQIGVVRLDHIGVDRRRKTRLDRLDEIRLLIIITCR